MKQEQPKPMKHFAQCEKEDCKKYYPTWFVQEVNIENKGRMLWCKDCIRKTLNFKQKAK